jgi:SpoVK/Ycf46/Vps4 family AAA+-type ATPase
MKFVGNPGTGKTTVARRVMDLYYAMGIVKKKKFVETKPSELMSHWSSVTNVKAKNIIESAYGGVLFIDEAYGFVTNGERGMQALEEVLVAMENHHTDLIVIMAGYKDEMEGLMKGNPGLRSRMPFLIEFPSYTPTQLAAIFMQMVNKHFKYDESLAPAVTEYFDSLPKEYLESKEFANGRFVRNLYERTWSKAALRMQLNKQGEVVLSVEDFKAACEEKEFSEKLERKKTIGFSN